MIIRRQNIVIMIFLWSIGFAADASHPDSHRSVISRLSQETLTSAVADGLTFPASAMCFTAGKNSWNEIVRTAVLQTLLERTEKVYTAPDIPDTLFSLALNDVVLTYGSPFSTSFLGARKVERTITVTAEISLTTKQSERILYSSVITLSSTDTVLFSAIEALHDPSLPFTSPPLPAVSFIDTILEPAIITIASAVAVYLFFTIRS
jgi:hypothetical protein